jgi:Skp family chaperone for outer membrane proteins
MLSKISLAISLLLSIAVGYLLFKKPAAANSAVGTQVEVAPALQSEGGPKPTILAYINGDSLNEKYTFIVEKTNQLNGRMDAAEKKIKAEYAKRQKELQTWEEYAQKNKLTPEEQQTAAEELQRLQTEMQAIEEREHGTLVQQEEALQKELMKRVNTYVEKFAKEKGLDYVVNYQSGFQFILYGNKGYDITSEVVAGLNAEYELEKGGK